MCFFIKYLKLFIIVKLLNKNNNGKYVRLSDHFYYMFFNYFADHLSYLVVIFIFPTFILFIFFTFVL